MTWQALALVAALTFGTVVAVVVHELTWEPWSPPASLDVDGEAKRVLDLLKPFVKLICDEAPFSGATMRHVWTGEYSLFIACSVKEGRT